MRKTNKYLIILPILYLSCLLLIFPLAQSLLHYGVSELRSDFIGQIIVLIPLLIALIWLVKELGFKRFNGINGGIKIEKSKLLFLPLLLLIYAVFTNYNKIINSDITDLLLLTISVILVGFSEEFFFRGILLPLVITKLKNKKHFLFLSIFISSFIFGIFHFIKLINYPSYISIITYQVIFTFCLGCLLSGLLLRTKSIIIPSLFHAIVNFRALIEKPEQLGEKPIEYSEEFLSKMPEMPTIWNALIGELPFYLLLLFLGYLMIRKIDEKEILKKLTVSSTTANQEQR